MVDTEELKETQLRIPATSNPDDLRSGGDNQWGRTPPPLEDKFASYMKIETKDEEFIKNNQKNDEWQHGIKVPYTVFELNTDKQEGTNSIGIIKQDIFLPKLALDQVAHAAFGHPSRLSSQNDCTQESQKLDIDENIIRENHSTSVFSGYYSIPKFTVNVPLFHHKNLSKSSLSSLMDGPKVCYQNHYDLDDLTYSFGGLNISALTSLSYLGIPKNVPLEKVSVHFPCKLPPFVNKNILTNPLIVNHNNFFMFNPLRGSITYLDALSEEDPNQPANISALISCQISPVHVFFYGGFLIVNERVEYFKDIERWVIHRNFVLNQHGFILDTVSMSFSKIELKAKEAHEDVHIGRIGAAICSNLFESVDESNSDLPARVPSPPIFTTSSMSNEPVFVPRRNSKLAISTAAKLNDQNNSFDSPIVLDELETPGKSVESTTKVAVKVSENTSSTNSASLASSETSSTKFTSTMTNLKTTSTNNSLHHSLSGQSSTASTASTNEGTLSSKKRMGNVLSKSSKIFHRSHHPKPPVPTSPPSKSTVSHALKNTYSSHVRDHRSNSSQTLESSKSVLEESSTIKSKHEAQLKEEFHHRSTSEGSGVTFTDPPIQEESQSSNSSSTKPPLSHTSSLTKYGQDEACDNEENSSENSSSMNSNKLRNNILFNETIFKSGINSVAIFIFGGFYSIEENGTQIFKASDDLLKIDLGLKEDGEGVKFHSEALVCCIGNGNGESTVLRTSEVWPSPRGYCASTLVNYNSRLLDNCLFDAVSEKDQVLAREPIERVPSPVSVFSTESGTFETESRTSRDARQSAESYFKKKSLIVHGGCNEQGAVFSDLYLFEFSTGKWQVLPTYAFDYFKMPKKPYEDDDGSLLLKENEVEEAELIEAELRSCHHSALYYQSDQSDFIFFMGGFKNDYLRHFDKVPYESDKFDVSRLSKFTFVANNDNILRIPVLNLQNQTWKFLRYYYDVNQVLSDKYIKKLNNNPTWVNANLNNYAGSISLNGKSITICHGLCSVSTEKAADFDKLEDDIGGDPMFWGTHVHFSFPSL